jgi:Uma2 family endonuclease
MSVVLDDLDSVLDLEPAEISRLGPDSNGLLMSAGEFHAIDHVDEGYRYELIHGVVVVSPPPAEGERDPNEELGTWLRMHRLTVPQGQSIDATLPEQEIDTASGIRRADRAIWCGLGRHPDPRADVPAIVVEFVSDTTRDRRRDYEEKRKEYASAGVKEYWIIDRFRRTMTVCRGDEKPQIVREKDVYTTSLLPGFELPLARLLEVADRWTKG